jgi:hypothetical protein
MEEREADSEGEQGGEWELGEVVGRGTCGVVRVLRQWRGQERKVKGNSTFFFLFFDKNSKGALDGLPPFHNCFISR